MATLRDFLNAIEFDWTVGQVYIQPVDSRHPGWDVPEHPELRPATEEELDRKFDSGYGGPECPRFVAEDSEAIYFPCQYDGSTWGEKVYKDLARYRIVPTPYLGG